MQQVAEDRYKKYLELMLRSHSTDEKKTEELIQAIPTVMRITEIKVDGPPTTDSNLLSCGSPAKSEESKTDTR